MKEDVIVKDDGTPRMTEVPTENYILLVDHGDSMTSQGDLSPAMLHQLMFNFLMDNREFINAVGTAAMLADLSGKKSEEMTGDEIFSNYKTIN